MLHLNETAIKPDFYVKNEIRVPANPTPAPEAGVGVGAERRQVPRHPVIKTAKLIFTREGSVHNCLVLDESAGGVLVDMGIMIAVPEDVTIQFANGATFLARRRWSAGTKCGLHFTGAQIISDETAVRMKKISEILRQQGLDSAISTLRAARFFDNAELRRAAEDVEAANARFEATLEGRLII